MLTISRFPKVALGVGDHSPQESHEAGANVLVRHLLKTKWCFCETKHGIVDHQSRNSGQLHIELLNLAIRKFHDPSVSTELIANEVPLCSRWRRWGVPQKGAAIEFCYMQFNLRWEFPFLEHSISQLNKVLHYRVILIALIPRVEIRLGTPKVF